VRRPGEVRRLLPAPPRVGPLTPAASTLIGVGPVLVVASILVYVAGLVLLAWEGRRDVAILLAAVGGVALSIVTLP
jgi:hypothetical protein